jgi:spermidine synthase
MLERQFESPVSRGASRLLPFLIILFAGSGCAALIYEIVWFQLLQLVIGSSAVSLCVLLTTFMGGMCLGSLALPRVVSARRHPLLVYAIIEMALGLCGLSVLFAMPLVDGLYAQLTDNGFSGLFQRGAICAICLLAPTILMGATLPAVARWVETTPQGMSWLGLFYGSNIAGAVFGCLLAGFYLLRVYDMRTATYAAAGINVGVAFLGLWLTAIAKYEPRVARAANSEQAQPAPPLALPVYITIAISGATALAAEVIWTRSLSLLLGATVYTFSIILAVFLTGLGIGSSVGSMLARLSSRPRTALGICQFLLAGAIAWTAAMLANSLPYWPINPYLSTNPWLNFQLDLARCLWAILPAACLWGASFPLALAAATTPGGDAGRVVGGVYAANTIGAIVGASGASLFLIRTLGSQTAQQILIGFSALGALLMLFRLRPISLRGPALAVTISGGAALLAWSVPVVPWQLVAFGRALPTTTGNWSKLYVGEGMNSSIAVTELDGGVRNFHVSGKIEASSEPQDMRLQRMLAHIPAFFHTHPRSVLVVGCGAGVTAGSFVVHPDVERIVICEIEALVPQAVAGYFAKQNYDVVHNPRVALVYDDGRHYVHTTPEKFDIITSDPIHPWVKGSATLYTKEYFELCKSRLNPGGMITQWVPLYESNSDVVQSEIATFFEVFPHGTIWANDNDGKGYDVVLLGQVEAPVIDIDQLQEKFDRPGHAEATASLREVGLGSALDLLTTYAGQASDLKTWLENAQINRDRNLRLQYLAGMELNNQKGAEIRDQIAAFRQFPENLFAGASPRLQLLRRALALPPSSQ